MKTLIENWQAIVALILGIPLMIFTIRYVARSTNQEKLEKAIKLINEHLGKFTCQDYLRLFQNIENNTTQGYPWNAVLQGDVQKIAKHSFYQRTINIEKLGHRELIDLIGVLNQLLEKYSVNINLTSWEILQSAVQKFLMIDESARESAKPHVIKEKKETVEVFLNYTVNMVKFYPSDTLSVLRGVRPFILSYADKKSTIMLSLYNIYSAENARVRKTWEDHLLGLSKEAMAAKSIYEEKLQQ